MREVSTRDLAMITRAAESYRRRVEAVRADLGLSSLAMGVLTTLPVLSMVGIFLLGLGPLIALIIIYAGVVLNIFLNWIFIYGHLGSPALGVAGMFKDTLRPSRLRLMPSRWSL